MYNKTITVSLWRENKTEYYPLRVKDDVSLSDDLLNDVQENANLKRLVSEWPHSADKAWRTYRYHCGYVHLFWKNLLLEVHVSGHDRRDLKIWIITKYGMK